LAGAASFRSRIIACFRLGKQLERFVPRVGQFQSWISSDREPWLAAVFRPIAEDPGLASLAGNPKDKPADLVIKYLDPLAVARGQGLDKIVV